MLNEMQLAVGRYLLGGDAASLDGLVAEDQIPAHKRLLVHRGNVMGSLVTVLAELYPAVERLAGRTRFRAVAAQFVALHPPVEPRLSSYGSGFAEFLVGTDLFQDFPFAPDLARLELARHVCALAAEDPRLDLTALRKVAAADIPGLRLSLHPAAALLSLAYTVSPLWRRLTIDGLDPCAAPADAERLLLRRLDAGIAQSPLSAAEHDFLLALEGGSTLADAAGKAAQVDPLFDLTGCLATHLAAATFAGFATSP